MITQAINCPDCGRVVTQRGEDPAALTGVCDEGHVVTSAQHPEADAQAAPLTKAVPRVAIDGFDAPSLAAHDGLAERVTALEERLDALEAKPPVVPATTDVGDGPEDAE